MSLAATQERLNILQNLWIINSKYTFPAFHSSEETQTNGVKAWMDNFIQNSDYNMCTRASSWCLCLKECAKARSIFIFCMKYFISSILFVFITGPTTGPTTDAAPPKEKSDASTQTEEPIGNVLFAWTVR